MLNLGLKITSIITQAAATVIDVWNLINDTSNTENRHCEDIG